MASPSSSTLAPSPPSTRPATAPGLPLSHAATTSNAIEEQLVSPLFLLPYEIRDRVYELYLSFSDTDFSDTLRPMHTYLEAATPHATPLPSLMLTCKRAYTELSPRVHATAALRVHHRGAYSGRRVGFATHGTLRFERLHRLVLIVDMEHANWNAWLDFFAAVAGRAPQLEHLVVDWRPRPVSPKLIDWQWRQNQKKEDKFLEVLCGMGSLETLSMYGPVTEDWKERIWQGTRAKATFFPFRWWREPGLE